MRKLYWSIVVLGIGCFALGLSTYAVPEALCVLLAGALFFALVFLFLVVSSVGLTQWRKTSRSWFVPALLCLFFILCRWYFASPLGQRIADRRSEKHLAEYSEVVKGFRDGTLVCESMCNGDWYSVKSTKTQQEPRQPTGVRLIWGERCDDGGLALLFLFDTDVPLLHEGYIFKSYGEKSNCNTSP